MKDLCRTCGKKPQNSNLRNIFKKFVLLKLIKEFTGLELKNYHKLPVNICSDCYKMLKEMFNFKQRCILVENYFNKRRIKESKAIKMLSKTIESDSPAVSNKIDGDEIIFIDLVESDQEQEDSIGQQDKNYTSTQDLSKEFTYGSISQDSSQEEGSINLDNTDEMANSAKPDFDEIEFFEIDAGDNDDMELENIPNEINETVADENKKTKSYVSKQLETICEICGKILKNNSILKKHLNTHNTIKAFECSHCPKAFHTSYELKKHERVHTENHPYVCSYCSDKFSYASAKIRHEKIHTNKRPHKCSYCEKAFIDSAALKNHETTHTRIRNYHCDICGHWSLTAKQLKVHCNSKAHKRNELEHNLKRQID